MPTNFIDFFKQRERGGTQNKKKEEVNKKHKSNLTDILRKDSEAAFKSLARNLALDSQ